MFEGVTRSPHIGDWEESVGRHEAGEMEGQESRQGLRMQSIILYVQVYGSLPWPQIMWLREGKPGDRGRAFEVVQVEMMMG